MTKGFRCSGSQQRRDAGFQGRVRIFGNGEIALGAKHAQEVESLAGRGRGEEFILLISLEMQRHRLAVDYRFMNGA